jgi:hypothetical protein
MKINKTTDFERCLKLQKDWLTDEDISSLHCQSTYLVLCEVHRFTRLCSSNAEQFFDDVIDIYVTPWFL